MSDFNRESLWLESKTARNSDLDNISNDRAQELMDKAKGSIFAVWQGQGICTTEQLAEYYEVTPEVIRANLKNHRDEFEGDGAKTTSRGDSGLRELLSLNHQGGKVMLWTPRAALRVGMILRVSPVAPKLRTLLLDIVEAVGDRTQDAREKLEAEFDPRPLGDIREAAEMARDFFSASYAQSFVLRSMALHHPSLPMPPVPAADRVPLESADVPMRPTDIGVALGWMTGSGKGDARRVNCVLAQMGYQVKQAGQWTPIEEGHEFAVRILVTPMDENGKLRTQRDVTQLMWKPAIVDAIKGWEVA